MSGKNNFNSIGGIFFMKNWKKFLVASLACSAIFARFSGPVTFIL